MKNFNWKKFNEGRIIVHCNTEEKANDFLNECENRGIKWNNGMTATFNNCYIHFKSKTAYENSFGKGLEYGSIEIMTNDEVIEWEIEDNEKKFGVVAYYATAFEGKELKQLFIDVENITDITTIYKIALRNENRFPHGQLIKIEIIPIADND